MATTIPASGTKFSDVRNAFNTEGYGISTSFFAYRQGGGIVPSSSTFNVIGAGTGGDPLRLSQFSGFTVPTPINFTTASYLTSGLSDDLSGPTEYANVKYQINADGYVYVDSGYSGLTAGEQWATPTSLASNYEIRATLDSGTIQTGTFGSWLDMATTRTWEKIIYENGANQNETATVSFEVRRKTTTTNLDTWTITFTVELEELI